PNNLGFELRNSDHVALTGNTFLNNAIEVYVTGQAGGIVIQNWETGQSYTLFTQNTTLTNNVIDGGSGQTLLTDGSLGGDDWTKFQSTLSSDNNTWWNSDTTKSYLLPVPALWTKVDYTGWQSSTGKDQHSVWANPTNPGSACG